MNSITTLRLPAAATPRPAADARLIGALFVLAAVACFSGLDTTSKTINTVPVMMLVWFRFATQAAVTAAVLLPRRGKALLATRHPGLHLLRGALLLATCVFAFLSLRYVALGEFTAILMLTPVLMTVITALAFGQSVSRARWALIALALAGALLVARPGAAGWWSPALVMPLTMLALNTGFHLVTSRLARLDDAGTLHFYSGCAAAALAALALPLCWTPLASWTTWASLALVCALSTAGHGMLIVGYAKAGVAALTPLLFAQIAFSTLLGWRVFAHVPDAWASLGICLIAVGGSACSWLAIRERERSTATAP